MARAGCPVYHFAGARGCLPRMRVPWQPIS